MSQDQVSDVVSSTSSSRVLVLGGLGQVGQAIVGALREADRTVTVASQRMRPSDENALVVSVDTALQLLSRNEFDLAIYASTPGDYRKCVTSGPDSLRATAVACAMAKVPAVLISSTRVLEGYRIPISEGAEPLPSTAYGKRNALAEHEWQSISKDHLKVLRVSNAFLSPTPGVNSPQEKLLPWSLIDEGLVAGHIRFVTRHDSYRVFVSGKDIGEACLLLALSSGHVGPLATLPGMQITNADWYRMVQRIWPGVLGAAPTVEFGEELSTGARITASSLKDLGWKSSLTWDHIDQAASRWLLSRIRPR